ncbi:hypothetical protein U6B65_02015 [Oscillospiraceae bacterium MB08-C2-2]|nr:hypothetical protein U6B65_02015 [Oscillospiraceae bacterium MB08-C2-2]
MEITEKVAYLKGLIEGLGVNDSTKEGKVLLAMVDVLDDIALTVTDVEEGLDELYEQVDALDEDLGELEEYIFDEDDDECGCGHHHHHDEDFDDEELYEVVCPSCQDSVYLDEEMLDQGEINCPNCGQLLEFDLDMDENETDAADNE